MDLCYRVKKMISVFVESRKELWFFSVNRPIKQHLMHFIFRLISKQEQVRENLKQMLFKRFILTEKITLEFERIKMMLKIKGLNKNV